MKKELMNISEKSLMELGDIVNEEMLTVEDVNEMLEHTDKGRTKQAIRNCVTVLQKDPVLKKAIKRNELSGRMDIVKEVPWERRSEILTVTDTDDSNLKMYLEENHEITSERVIKKEWILFPMKISVIRFGTIWRAWYGTVFHELRIY